jgi:hypothetical protein
MIGSSGIEAAEIATGVDSDISDSSGTATGVSVEKPKSESILSLHQVLVVSHVMINVHSFSGFFSFSHSIERRDISGDHDRFHAETADCIISDEPSGVDFVSHSPMIINPQTAVELCTSAIDGIASVVSG